MKQAPIDELIKPFRSIYKLVVVASKRAKALAEGAPKLVSTDMKKVTSIALEEIHQGKIACELEESDAPKGARKTAKKKKS